MKPLVVGLGSVDRGDDAVGCSSCGRSRRRARGRRDRGLGPVATGGSGRGARCDGAGRCREFGIRAGNGARGGGRGPGPTDQVGRGKHALGRLGHAIELARVLDMLPARVVVVGIEAGALESGSGLSAPVNEAMPLAVAAVLALLE